MHAVVVGFVETLEDAVVVTLVEAVVVALEDAVVIALVVALVVPLVVAHVEAVVVALVGAGVVVLGLQPAALDRGHVLVGADLQPTFTVTRELLGAVNPLVYAAVVVVHVVDLQAVGLGGDHVA